MKKEKLKTVQYKDIELDEIPLDVLLNNVELWIDQYGKDAVITFGEYYGDPRLSIRWYLEETDDEYNKRMESYKKAVATRRKNNIARKKLKEEEDRKLYEELKARFEKA